MILIYLAGVNMYHHLDSLLHFGWGNWNKRYALSDGEYNINYDTYYIIPGIALFGMWGAFGYSWERNVITVEVLLLVSKWSPYFRTYWKPKPIAVPFCDGTRGTPILHMHVLFRRLSLDISPLKNCVHVFADKLLEISVWGGNCLELVWETNYLKPGGKSAWNRFGGGIIWNLCRVIFQQ